MLVRDLCIAHVKAGHDCAVASFNPSDDAFRSEVAGLAQAGVSVISPERAQKGISRLRSYLRAISFVAPDVIFGHSLLPALYGRLSVFMSRRASPFISVLHSSSDDYREWKIRIAERYTPSQPAAVVAVSQFGASFYARINPSYRKLNLIPNGIDIERFSPDVKRRSNDRDRYRIQPSDLLLLQVGRISSIKQQLFTLRSLIPMLRARSGVRLWFVGLVEDEGYCQALKEEIATAGLDDRVLVAGPRSDVPQIMNAADLFLMPSRAEAQGIGLLEALASGLSVVASDIDTFRFAGKFPGVELVQLGDEGGFADAVDRLLRPGVRHSRALEEFSIQRTAQTYLDLARKLMSEAEIPR